jgi:hypothetical protein
MMIDDKSYPVDKLAEAQQAMHAGYDNALPPPYVPPENPAGKSHPPAEARVPLILCSTVNVYYQSGSNEKAIDRDVGPSAILPASTSAPQTRDWSTVPTVEFAGAGGRLMNERDAPPSREVGRGLFSLLGRTQQPTYNAGIFPPVFSRLAPNFQPGVLRWFSPVLIQPRSNNLAQGFPAIFPAQELQSHDIFPADWQAFLQHIDAMIRSGVFSDPAGYGPAAQVLVSQWNGAFFGPRRIRVTLRPELHAGYSRGRIDNFDARSISSASSTSTSSSSSSSSSDDSRKHQKKKSGNYRGGWRSGVPHDGWMSPHAAAASASSWKVQRKLERDQKKGERKARRMERKERRRERKIARQEAKAMRKGKFVPPRPGSRWELLVECI